VSWICSTGAKVALATLRATTPSSSPVWPVWTISALRARTGPLVSRNSIFEVPITTSSPSFSFIGPKMRLPLRKVPLEEPRSRSTNSPPSRSTWLCLRETSRSASFTDAVVLRPSTLVSTSG